VSASLPEGPGFIFLYAARILWRNKDVDAIIRQICYWEPLSQPPELTEIRVGAEDYPQLSRSNQKIVTDRFSQQFLFFPKIPYDLDSHDGTE